MTSPTTSMRIPAKPPRTAAWTSSVRSNIGVQHGHRGLDELAERVTEEEVRLLHAARARVGHDDRDVHAARELAAVGARESHGERAKRRRGVDALEDVRAVARGREADGDVAGTAEALDLAGEDHVEGVVVGHGGDQGGVR